MDDVTIDIDRLVIKGSAPSDVDAVASALRRHTSEPLSAPLLRDVARAVTESARTEVDREKR